MAKCKIKMRKLATYITVYTLFLKELNKKGKISEPEIAQLQ